MTDPKAITENLRLFAERWRMNPQNGDRIYGMVWGEDGKEATVGLTASGLDEIADTIDALMRGRDEAWSVIKSDHWRNRYDEDMAAGNAVVAALTAERDALAAVVEKVRNIANESTVYPLSGDIRIALSTAPADALAERDRQMSEKAWNAGARWGAVEFGTVASEDQVGLVPSDNPHWKETQP